MKHAGAAAARGPGADRKSGAAGWLDTLSIRDKLILAFAPLFSAVVLFQVLYFPAHQAAEAQTALVAKARSVAHLVAHDLGAAFEFDDEKGALEVFKGAQGDPDLLFLVVFRSDGRQLAALNAEKAPALHPLLPLSLIHI